MFSAAIQSSTVRLAIERHHDAADALDEQNAVGRLDRRAAEGDQLVEGNAAAFARGGEIGRQRRAEAPGRDALDLVGGHRPPERGQQHRRIAGLDDGGIVAAHHRLERVDRWFDVAQVRIRPAVTKVLPTSVPVEVTK